jgi:threonine dehydrogenase-like Zn-dependent dehydrogenase
MPPRVVVIGAGPMGLAAALGAIERGCETTVLERDEVGASLRSWGPTRFFTPLRMNVSNAMRGIVGDILPGDDELLTGPEFADILGELARRDPLRTRVRTRHSVVAVGRRGLTRSDYAGHPLRSERPFRLLLDSPNGEEVLEADVVLDASGGHTTPRPFGADGLPARGELLLNSRAIRTLGELHARREELRGKRILVVGHGHSAANALGSLAELARDEPSTRITWAVRTPNRRPCQDVADDPLTERQRVVQRANDLAESPPAFLNVERRVMIERVEENGSLTVTLTGGRREDFDVITAFTGFRPDARHLSELTVETSPVTEGGARLSRAISNVTDCLAVPRVTREDLQSGEPNFYFIGSRSYGRARSFLLQTGLQQLNTILESLPK